MTHDAFSFSDPLFGQVCFRIADGNGCVIDAQSAVEDFFLKILEAVRVEAAGAEEGVVTVYIVVVVKVGTPAVGLTWIVVPPGDQHSIRIVRIEPDCHQRLPDVIAAGDCPGSRSRFVEGGQQKACQNGDDCNHN